MTKNKVKVPVITFLAGVLFGFSLLGFYAFTTEPAGFPQSGEGDLISAVEANKYFRKYYDNAKVFDQKLKGVSINRDQLEAMMKLYKDARGAEAFRVYRGVKNNASVGIVVGVDSRGTDMSKNIYVTSSSNSGGCPPVCDSDSPITSY